MDKKSHVLPLPVSFFDLDPGVTDSSFGFRPVRAEFLICKSLM